MINIIKELTLDNKIEKINEITVNGTEYAFDKGKMTELGNNVIKNFKDLQVTYQNLVREDKSRDEVGETFNKKIDDNAGKFSDRFQPSAQDSWYGREAKRLKSIHY